MKNIAFLTNASAQSGVGSYAYELKKALQSFGEVKLEEISLNTEGLGPKTLRWIRKGLIFKAQHSHKYDLIHATNQTLSFAIRRNKPSIVTVHDIIEVLYPQQKLSRYAAQYLYSGVKQASHIIAVSHYTKKTIQEYFNIPEERISVIPNGVSSDFHPLTGIKKEKNTVLYVGSDHRRKNVITAIQAFAEVLKIIPEAVFLKVGEAGIRSGRNVLLTEIDRLNIRDKVRFIGSISQERLNELYNSSTVLIFPSEFEGFGLPPLQAMAAGLPVITSNTTSLPEVVGEAGLMHNPDDVESFTKSMISVLKDERLFDQLRHKGFEQAKKFNWSQVAAETLKIYQQLL